MPALSGQLAAALCLLLCAAPGQAHLPAVYGRDFLRASDSPAEVDCKPDISLPGMEDDLAARLDQLERSEGPYAQTLAEPLADLGRYYRRSGDHNDALRVFNRALHLVRVNEGLSSPAQLALLDELAETHRSIGDLPALDQVQVQKFRVQGQGRGTDIASLEASLDFLRWQRQAHGLGLDGNNMQRVLETYLLNQRLLEQLDKEGRAGEPEYRRLVLSQLSNLYLVMGAELEETSGAAIVMSAEVHPSQSGSESYVRQRVARMQLSGLKEGERLLQGLIDAIDPGQPLAIASMRLELADWLQWNGEFGRAADEYMLVASTLVDLGESALLQQWLGEPRELPDSRVFRQFDTGVTGTATGVEVAASFTVTTRGEARDVELTLPGDGASYHDNRFSRMLAGTHFRPRFVSGEAEQARVSARSYRLLTGDTHDLAGAECIAGVDNLAGGGS